MQAHVGVAADPMRVKARACVRAEAPAALPALVQIDPAKPDWIDSWSSTTWKGETCYTCMDYGHGGFVRA